MSKIKISLVAVLLMGNFVYGESTTSPVLERLRKFDTSNAIGQLIDNGSVNAGPLTISCPAFDGSSILNNNPDGIIDEIKGRIKQEFDKEFKNFADKLKGKFGGCEIRLNVNEAVCKNKIEVFLEDALSYVPEDEELGKKFNSFSDLGQKWLQKNVVGYGKDDTSKWGRQNDKNAANYCDAIGKRSDGLKENITDDIENERKINKIIRDAFHPTQEAEIKFMQSYLREKKGGNGNPKEAEITPGDSSEYIDNALTQISKQYDDDNIAKIKADTLSYFSNVSGTMSEETSSNFSSQLTQLIESTQSVARKVCLEEYGKEGEENIEGFNQCMEKKFAETMEKCYSVEEHKDKDDILNRSSKTTNNTKNPQSGNQGGTDKPDNDNQKNDDPQKICGEIFAYFNKQRQERQGLLQGLKMKANPTYSKYSSIKEINEIPMSQSDRVKAYMEFVKQFNADLLNSIRTQEQIALLDELGRLELKHSISSAKPFDAGSSAAATTMIVSKSKKDACKTVMNIIGDGDTNGCKEDK